MIAAQMSNYKSAIAPAAIIDNASATAIAVDTAGSNYAELVVQLGATDIALTELKVTECDTSGGTYTDITGATFDGGTDTAGGTLALPSATDDGQTCVFQVNMDNRKRFLKVVCTFGDGAAGGFVAAVARLSNVDVVSATDTDLADGGVCRV